MTYQQGTTASLNALFFSAPGVPVAVDNLSLSVVSLTDASVVLGPVTGSFLNPQLGAYIYQWAIAIDLPVGEYLVSWAGDVAGDPISAVETITVISPGGGTYVPGACQTWPIKWPGTCELDTASPEITGIALEAAQDLLYMLTAQRFSQCSTTLRPCREECYGSGGYGWGWRSMWWGDTVGYPTPVNISGQWYNLGCGSCGQNCSCTPISEVYLPGPVAQINEVKVDGVVLVNGVDYRIDDYRKLVRIGDVWPFCNDLNKADTEIGTWSVNATFGEPVPMLGQLAVGEVACDIVNFLLGEDCKLPAGITDLTRQGVSMSFADVDNSLTTFFAKFPISYLFVKTYNPNQLMARARAYDLDGPDFRITGTSM